MEGVALALHRPHPVLLVSMDSLILDPRGARDLSDVLLDAQGNLCAVPAEVLVQTTQTERSIFCVRQGLYGLLTLELLEYLAKVIDGRTAIEIGAGHGRLAHYLGIPATDNRQQERPEIRAIYETLKQPVVRYGANVEPLDAAAAVRHHRPQVVVASWVTHRYDPRRHEAGGNQDGVDEEDVLAHCDTYVFMGNEHVHAKKSLWSQPHTKLHAPWLFSRAGNGSPDFIAVWNRAR